MSVAALLAELRSLEIEVSTDGERLRCNAPPGALTPQMRSLIQEHKAEIVEFLRSVQDLAGQQRAVVPLQPHGSRMPVFGIPGHNGDVFCYRALARALGPEQPFFGLQPPGLDGKTKPLERVDDIASYFANQIRVFRPSGPFAIVGFCAGGTVAFALVRRLALLGVPVPFLGLFGSPFPSYFRRAQQLRERLYGQVARAGHIAREFITKAPQQRASYLLRKLREREARIEAAHLAAHDPVLALRRGVEDATLRAVRSYSPEILSRPVCLFLPSRDWKGASLATRGWRTVARPMHVYFGPDGCTNDNMLLEPNAPVFAGLLAACLRGDRNSAASQMTKTASWTTEHPIYGGRQTRGPERA
jgi:thioesterase domain-containing protein